jgi:hypothetical protein
VGVWKQSLNLGAIQEEPRQLQFLYWSMSLFCVCGNMATGPVYIVIMFEILIMNIMCKVRGMGKDSILYSH